MKAHLEMGPRCVPFLEEVSSKLSDASLVSSDWSGRRSSSRAKKGVVRSNKSRVSERCLPDLRSSLRYRVFWARRRRRSLRARPWISLPSALRTR